MKPPKPRNVPARNLASREHRPRVIPDKRVENTRARAYQEIKEGILSGRYYLPPGTGKTIQAKDE